MYKESLVVQSQIVISWVGVPYFWQFYYTVLVILVKSSYLRRKLHKNCNNIYILPYINKLKVKYI